MVQYVRDAEVGGCRKPVSGDRENPTRVCTVSYAPIPRLLLVPGCRRFWASQKGVRSREERPQESHLRCALIFRWFSAINPRQESVCETHPCIRLAPSCG